MDTKQLADKLVSWLKEQVLATQCAGAVIGMSGGVDSSVVAVLCRRALPQNVLGVIIPCHSKQEDEEHARMVADKFSIPTRKVALDTAFDILIDSLPDEKGEASLRELARANLKPRLRMLTLYYIANQLRYMVAGSGNRSELAVGYFTKYGDGGVDILPLGNLVKGQVRELAKYLEIPQPIIEKSPSAGLWEGQTDEDEMGLSYKELDRYLLTGEAIGTLKKKIEMMAKISNHKRQTLPIPAFRI